MKTIYTDHGRPWPERAQTLQQATGWLEKAIGAQADTVTAEWDRTTDDKGKAVYDLRISDGTDSASARIEPDVLSSPTLMRIQFHLLWGKVLQARTHRQLRRLLATSGAEN